ncbi:N-acetylmuramoyl-L-alanine amidase family protein [Robiginitalea aurantiaca]|uniref:N-acetylmuramoyl-L-alanine amidase n=1 Tax=Robiginitalea aurantiaca TaxID=3056915 RepID=A0ABT7WI44_9FLAO|nr:N-acetylmuramoyl-L-alanine amidase [Robiginitalea aurantiaca]MDM9632576.1 N-acetylmuramoyl-L-alanine amidase [Robiginitalea aurantiaca]
MKAQAALGDPAGDIPFTVVLDAGHGGHDPGNLGNGFLEKNIALSIVLQAGKALEADGNVKVIYTRDDDTFVDLYKRGEIANKAQADLFVSVHCDSHNSNANGAGTFVLGLHANKQNFEVAKKENSVIYLEDNYESRYADYDISSPESVIGLTIMQEEFLDQSILLGKLMQDRFTGNLKRKDRKVKQAGFIVLHQTFMPSVLIETGFLTNRDEGQYLNSKKGQQDMGQAIANAILEYRNTIRSNSTTLNASSGMSAADAEDTNESTEVVSVVPALKKTEEPEVDTPPVSEKSVEVAADEIKQAQVKGEGAQAGQAAVTAGVAAGTPDTEKSNGKDITSIDEKESGAKAIIAEDPIEEKNVASEVSEKKDIQPAVSDKPEVLFKVQLMAVSKDMALTPSNFKGLNTLSKEPVNNMYRILYGSTTSYEQAKVLQAGAIKKGYTQAYIVAYKDGERIPVDKAVKYLSN